LSASWLPIPVLQKHPDRRIVRLLRFLTRGKGKK
jgi:hypothetical protein